MAKAPAERPNSRCRNGFCCSVLASDTDWVKAGVTHATAQMMLVRGLVDRDTSNHFALTDQGRAALSALMGRE
jgi:hypothetical protein